MQSMYDEFTGGFFNQGEEGADETAAGSDEADLDEDETGDEPVEAEEEL